MFQRVGKAAYKADLSNTWKLTEYLGHPEKEFKSVHVAGTNGKGSTSHMLASVLQEAGYKVGLYTSPHLKDFRERIKINGKMILKRSVSRFVSRHQSFFETNKLSFFEMTVGMAFDYFRSEKVDIAIVEVGLGGRMDSTNIIMPEVAVITNIGMDHTQFLGNSLEEIAREKAGIIKPKLPVVIGESVPETKDVFIRIAAEKSAPVTWASEEMWITCPTDLHGHYQKVNQRTALTTLQILQRKGWTISETHIAAGMQNVVSNTGLMGRWQVLGLRPKVICDTAHNREGLMYTMQQLESETFDKLHVVVGLVKDKNPDPLLQLFPEKATYYFCQPKIERGLDKTILWEKGREYGLIGECFDSVEQAYRSAVKNAAPEDLIYVGGSTFVVAEVL